MDYEFLLWMDKFLEALGNQGLLDVHIINEFKQFAIDVSTEYEYEYRKQLGDLVHFGNEKDKDGNYDKSKPIYRDLTIDDVKDDRKAGKKFVVSWLYILILEVLSETGEAAGDYEVSISSNYQHR